jgi:hypothetical protein
VGLRWWIEFSEEGKEKWVFECRGDPQAQNQYDSYVFWGALFLSFGYWTTDLVFHIISFSVATVGI